MDGFGDSMVDRVAKAIWDAENPYDGDPVAVTIHNADCLPVVGDDKGLPAARELCRVIARAAIEAMREPTEAMRHAVWYDQYITCGGTPEMADQLARQRVENPTQREQDLSSFGALIDAALAEPTAPR